MDPTRRLITCLASIALPCVAAHAATLTVNVTNGGRPAADVVVTIHAVGRPTPAMRVAGPYVVNQKDIQFHPFMTVVPVGADVSFPNLDPIRHHVYSFSTAKRFELKLYARDQTRSVHFDKAGAIAVGCNIHDSMSAYIAVTDSAWTAKIDASGRASFSLPPGGYTMTLWHPYLRAPGNRIDKPVTIGAGDARETAAVALRPPPMHDMSGY